MALCIWDIFLRLASLGGGPQAHVHERHEMQGVIYLNVLGMNALFCEPMATPALQQPCGSGVYLYRCVQ